MNVFVTGATGFIGRSLVRSLLNRGWDVTALARRPDSSEARYIQSQGVRVVPGDITERSTLDGAVRGADVVIHNAAWFEYGMRGKQKEAMKAINLAGTENVLDAAIAARVPRIVYVSSVVAHGPTGQAPVDETYCSRPSNPTVYEQTKSEAHDAALRCLQEGAPLIIASPGSAVGPGDHSPLGYYARLYVRGRGFPVLPDGTMSFVQVDDCAEGIALAAEKGRLGEEYYLVGGPMKYREVFETWKTVPGGPKLAMHITRGPADFSALMTEAALRLFKMPVFISLEGLTVGSRTWCFTGAKAESELGAKFRPPRQAWLETLEVERQRARQGISWRYTGA